MASLYTILSKEPGKIASFSEESLPVLIDEDELPILKKVLRDSARTSY